MSDLTRDDFVTRCQRVLQYSQNLFHSNPDWVTFFREVLGVNGAARKLFPNQREFIAFESSQEFNRIQQMVHALRHRKGANGHVDEPTRVITVRLPESLHEALKQEATDHSTSMNKLCISKLLQVLANSPKTSHARPGTAQPAPVTAQPGHAMNSQPASPQPMAQPAFPDRTTSSQPSMPTNTPAPAPAASPTAPGQQAGAPIRTGGYVFDPNRGGYRG